MFTEWLFELRDQGLKVSTGQWLSLLSALQKGLATDLMELYHLGRALLCTSEDQFDAYDRAFASVFGDLDLPVEMKEELRRWLEGLLQAKGPPVDSPYQSLEELLEAYRKTLEEQKGKHDGGNRWVGRGGTSPWGHSGRGKDGIRVGGPGGGRMAVRVAGERRWSDYRKDRVLDVRDFQVALKALRKLAREGRTELDLDESIAETARNGGEIELVERPEKVNRVHLWLLMDTGGSMTPHAERVEQLFSAASKLKIFKSFNPLYFHNCPYGWLYESYEENRRIATPDVLAKLSSRDRVIFVGDASMAPYELLSSGGGWGRDAPTGLDWIRRFKESAPSIAWLNPDPIRFWDHPTVDAIRQLIPMYPLTVSGLQDAVKQLRRPV